MQRDLTHALSWLNTQLPIQIFFTSFQHNRGGYFCKLIFLYNACYFFYTKNQIIHKIIYIFDRENSKKLEVHI